MNDPYADYVFTKQQRNAMMDDPEGVTVYELPGGKYMVCKRDADGALRMVTPDGIYSRRIYHDKNWRHVSVEEAMRATSVTGG